MTAMTANGLKKSNTWVCDCWMTADRLPVDAVLIILAHQWVTAGGLPDDCRATSADWGRKTEYRTDLGP